MMTLRFAASLALTLALAAPAHAGGLKSLAKKLAKGLKGEKNRKVAVLSFSYHGGKYSSGSSIVAERLTTYLVERGKVEVVERALLDKVLSEMKLERSGVIDEKTTHELGRVLGVAAVVTGTLNDLKKEKTEVNARLIHTQTGKVLAAGNTKIKREWKDSPVLARPPRTDDPGKPPTENPMLGRSLAQLAILLDTSNSMDGLIAQAKTQLWKIVNELASSEKEGNNPDLRVALYEYGNDGLSKGEGYIRQVLPFTSDLDKVSEELFALKTNGGQEYAGTVIRDAVDGLTWAREADVYKAIFIAGNEPFTQGPVLFQNSVASAKAKNVFVNTIFCGPRQRGIATQWKAGADLSGGEYMNIDQERRVVAIRAPQDDEIERLGRDLNRTYIPYGSSGRRSYERQAAQDSLAMEESAAGAAVQRAMFKAKKQYSKGTSKWDAVSLVESGKTKAKDLKKENLPAPMRKMSVREREAYINERIGKRKRIQDKIRKLTQERKRYVSEEERRRAEGGGPETLDQVMIRSIRKQAATREYKFK